MRHLFFHLCVFVTMIWGISSHWVYADFEWIGGGNTTALDDSTNWKDGLVSNGSAPTWFKVANTTVTKASTESSYLSFSTGDFYFLADTKLNGLNTIQNGARLIIEGSTVTANGTTHMGKGSIVVGSNKNGVYGGGTFVSSQLDAGSVGVNTTEVIGNGVIKGLRYISTYNSGTVNLRDNGTIYSNIANLLEIGNSATATHYGTLNQYGGTIWNSTGNGAVDLRVGSSKSLATYNYYAGTMNATITVGVAAASQGIFNIQPGAILNTANAFTVGKGAGANKAELNIAPTAKLVTSNALTLGTDGKLTLQYNGGQFGTVDISDTGSFTNHGTVQVDWGQTVGLIKDYTANGVALISGGVTTMGTVTTANDQMQGQIVEDSLYLQMANESAGTIGFNSGHESTLTPSSRGWAKLSGNTGEKFEITLNIEGLTADNSDDVLSAFNTNPELFATYDDVENTVVLHSEVFSALGEILVWDLTGLETQLGTTLQVTGATGQDVPEPASWGLFFMGLGLLFLRKKGNRI